MGSIVGPEWWPVATKNPSILGSDGFEFEAMLYPQFRKARNHSRWEGGGKQCLPENVCQEELQIAV